MSSIGRFFSGISEAFELNQATLSGALDVVVVEHDDGSMLCTPFHVRFGKLQLLKSREKTVQIKVNGEHVPLAMKLGAAGEAFFVETCIEEVEQDLATSPIESPEGSPPLSPIIEPQEETKFPPHQLLDAAEIVAGTAQAIVQEAADMLPAPKPSRWHWLWGKLPQKNAEIAVAPISQTLQHTAIHETPPSPNVSQQRGLFGSIFNMFKRGSAPSKVAHSHPVEPQFGDSDIVDEEEEQEEESQVELSLCKHLISPSVDLNSIFEANKVPFAEFSSDPWAIINHPNLMVRIEDKLYEWNEALPLILSLLIYKRPLNEPQSSPEPIPEPIPSAFSYESEPLPKANTLPAILKKPTDDNKHFKKTLRLSSDQLRKLNLKEGPNEIIYIVNSRFQGIQHLTGRVYLWNCHSKIVVSDVDGTITKSDVLGHILPMVGKDWSHPGVVQLYNNITANGYKMLYLTSRAIGQARTTKEYLTSLNQGNQLLPDGPVIMSPDRLIHSFMREVIHRSPQKFKAGVLRDISGLFGFQNPFYAGFGNRDTDAIAYRAAGVPLHRIFLINPDGNIYMLNNTFVKSYPALNELVADMFPPLGGI
jgi:phosphatidate phosphatase LPIN